MYRAAIASSCPDAGVGLLEILLPLMCCIAGPLRPPSGGPAEASPGCLYLAFGDAAWIIDRQHEWLPRRKSVRGWLAAEGLPFALSRSPQSAAGLLCHHHRGTRSVDVPRRTGGLLCMSSHGVGIYEYMRPSCRCV